MTKTIVLIDNSTLTRDIVGSFLESRGFRVLSYDNGLEGLHAVFAESADLVVTDVDVPGLCGNQLVRFLKHRRETRRIPVVICAGLETVRDAYRARASGADAVVAKDPDSLEELGAEIDRLLGEGDESSDEQDEQDEQDEPIELRKPDLTMILETIASLNERKLFHAQIRDRLHEASRHMRNLADTAKTVLATLDLVGEIHISALVLRYHREARVFLAPSERVFREDIDAFRKLCFDDFFRRPGNESVRTRREIVFGLENRDDFENTRIDGRRLSSYYAVPLEDETGSLTGTLHVGNLNNNYFSGNITEELDALGAEASVVIENAVRFNETEEMRAKINTIFAKFVPQEVIQDLLSQSEEAEMAVGEKRNVAILFSDIRSFTVISEHNTAEQIVSFLNRYLQEMVSIIRKHGGFIDKFIGDAILAIFGAPVSYEDNAHRAVQAAAEMAEAVKGITVEGLVLPDGGFQTGIGVHEGIVIVGNIGSQDKFDYTVIGDNVNLASRLEGLTKHYHAQIILSDTVRLSLPEELELREVDTVRVKGKEKATTLYSPVPPGSFDAESALNYRKALSMYRLGNWNMASDYFRMVLTRYPDDYLSSMYIERCRDFALNPPEADWGGAVKLDFK